MEEAEEGEGKGDLSGMPEDQDHSDPVFMLITHNAPPSHSPGWTIEQENQDFDIQNPEEFD